MDIRLATSLCNEMKPLAVQGVYAADCHAQLRALLARHASFLGDKGMPDAAQLLAEPVYDEASGTIDWYAEGTGSAVCLASFPKAEQEAVLQRMATYPAAVEALAERERTDPRSSGMGAGLLKAALAHPSGAEDVFLVDGHLVLVNWGFGLGAQETGPENIMRLGGAASQPKAPQEASVQDRSIPSGQPSQTASAVPPAPGAQPPSQPPLPPASQPAGSGQLPLTQPPLAQPPLLVCQERTRPLSWLVPLGLGALALWLVLAGVGLAPSPLPVAFLRQESPQGRLERIKTAQLDDEEARLLASLQAHSAQCRPERQEPMEAPLERKAVIPDLSAPEPEPQLPDAQAKPEEPKEEAKNEPKDEPKDETKVEPRPLPRQEFKPDFKAEAPLPEVREKPRLEPREEVKEEPKDEPKDEKKDEALASPPEQTPFFGEAPLVPEEPEEKEKPRTRPVVREKPVASREKPVAAKEKPVQARPVQPREKPVPAREEPKPAPKPEAKPEAKAEAKPQPAPRRGEDLKIPEDAARRNDLSFLKGCWVSDTGLHNNHGVPIVGEYCFNGRGGGTRFVREPNGQRCSGRVQARFTGGGLHIDSQEAPCPNGTKYVPQRVECRG
ncbi:MAG: hypothetical protein K6E40_04140, partial [Desulfovibrio sp.]|nr:hypothetical protein [Desulfovibrio sp.]